MNNDVYYELHNQLVDKLDTEYAHEVPGTVLYCGSVPNVNTCQQMVFCPADGKMLAW